MATRKLGIIMYGVTGRMGTHQHLARSIAAIRAEGGVLLTDGTRVIPDPILVGRSATRLKALAKAHGVERWTTDLDAALRDKKDTVFFEAATRSFKRHKPTSFPLAAMTLESLRPAVSVDMAPGDILVLLSDGIYEYRDARDEEFGERRVEDIVRAHHGKSAAELSAMLLGSVQAFAGNAMQEDDMTVVLVKRKEER